MHGECLKHSIPATLTVISDSAVFSALANGVKTVLLGCYSVLPNGGILAQAGTKNAVQAAHYYQTPVIVLAPWYKLTPVKLEAKGTLMDYGSP